MRPIDADAMMMRVNLHGTNKYGVLHDVDIRAFINEQPTIDAISMREWNLIRNSIKELHENNPEKKDVQFATKFLLRLMDISERREFNNEM